MDFCNLPLHPYDKGAEELAKKRWRVIAKPLDSLGLLEDAVIKISALTGDPNYRLDKRAALVLCSDNGVVAQGVTQTGSEVTAVVANNVTIGEASVCMMSRTADCDCFAIDMGMNEKQPNDKIIDRRIAPGTQDISQGPAMTREQAKACLKVGIDLVGDFKARGYKIISAGEMGIGNTTTCSAMAAALLEVDPLITTGRGAGLSTPGLKNKVEVIRRAIEVNKPDINDPIGVLQKLGGFDIGGMAGLFLGGAIHGVPILIDGVISSVAALCAVRICPESKRAMLSSHVSAEPAGGLVLEALGLKPLINAGMCLGEGTGAVAALPLLDMAYTVYREMASFEDIKIDAYEPLE